ncbi:MAG: hypothetical protein ACK4SZ_03020 [Allosphingosinicella sp.]|uniref:hypothetical protein n=1 Tax=Allosphingosinicella sp. TaxID=2823234 RepID=UPI00395E5A9F
MTDPKHDRPHSRREPGSSLPTASTAGRRNQPESKRLNVLIQSALFDAAARRVGSTSPTIVIEAALAALASQNQLGPWLAENWGVLSDADPELLDELDF